MRKQFNFLFSIGLILFFVFGTGSDSAAQRRRTKRAKPAVAAAPINDPEYLETLELLQAAKVYQLMAELQLSLASAYLENRSIGERDAKRALAKLDGEQRKNPLNLMTNYGQARGYIIWSNYLFDRNSYGTNVVSDKTIALNASIIRKAVAKGLAINPNFPFLIAAHASLRGIDCRTGKFSSEQDCYLQPLEELSRAIAMRPDESEIITMRVELYERRGQTALAEKDSQSVENLQDALRFKFKLDEKTNGANDFQYERAEINTSYFVTLLDLLLDENIKAQLAKDAVVAAAFRKKLFEYYNLADKGFTEANLKKQTAQNFARRGLLRLNVGLFAAALKLDNPTEAAKENWQKAVEFFNEAIKLDAKFIEAYKFRAQAYRKLGKTDLANADEKQAELLSK